MCWCGEEVKVSHVILAQGWESVKIILLQNVQPENVTMDCTCAHVVPVVDC